MPNFTERIYDFDQSVEIIKTILNKYFGEDNHNYSRHPWFFSRLLAGKVSIESGLRTCQEERNNQVTGQNILDFFKLNDDTKNIGRDMIINSFSDHQRILDNQ